MKTVVTFFAAVMIALTTLAASTNPHPIEPVPNALVETPATFQDDNSLIQPWLAGAVAYPKLAMENSREGRVVVEFTINENGEPQNFVVRKALGLGCDEAVIDAIQQMPRWTPAQAGGKTVPVTLTVAVDFGLF